MGKPALVPKSAGTVLGPILAYPFSLTLLCFGMAIWAARVLFTTAKLPKAAIFINGSALLFWVMLEIAVPSFLALPYHPHFAVLILVVVVMVLVCTGRCITPRILRVLRIL